MLLLWLCGSALMTLRVGAKHQQVASPTRTAGGSDQSHLAEALEGDDEEPVAGPVSQPQMTSEAQATGAASSLGLTRGQRPVEHAGPEMAFFAASADR